MGYNPNRNNHRGNTVEYHKICVIGLGYIGLPTASTFADRGIEVVGVDNNPEIITGLQQGRLHLYEPRPGGARPPGAGFRQPGRTQPAGAGGCLHHRRSHPLPGWQEGGYALRGSACEADRPAPARGQPGGAGIDLAAAHHGRPGPADPGTLRAEGRARISSWLIRRSASCPGRSCAS